MVLNNAVCAQSADPAAAGSGLAAKAFAPASCFPSSLRRVNISQVHQTCEMFRLTTYFTEECPFTPKPKANAPGQMGRAQVRLRGRIPGVDKRWQNESAELSRAAGR